MRKILALLFDIDLLVLFKVHQEFKALSKNLQKMTETKIFNVKKQYWLKNYVKK